LAGDARAYSYHPVGYMQISPECMHADVAHIAKEQKDIGYESEFIEGEADCMRYMRGLRERRCHRARVGGNRDPQHFPVRDRYLGPVRWGGSCMAELTTTNNASLGPYPEPLSGRTMQHFFSATEEENYLYPFSYSVDYNQRVEFDAAKLSSTEINLQIRQLMQEGHGTIVVHNPLAKHSLGVGILNRLRLHFEGSLGYFGCGLIDGPNIHIKGRVGWSCAENMLAGTVVVEKVAGSCFAAALRGGDVVCMGDVGGRTGIDQKGGTIIVGGRTGAFSGLARW
jgi:hypothetical protein